MHRPAAVSIDVVRQAAARHGERGARPHGGTMGAVAVYRDSAVVLRAIKLGEADRIIALLSRRHGLIRAVAKGVRRTRSRFGGRLEPFCHVDLQLYEGRSLDVITQAVTIDAFGPALASDYAHYTAATAVAETAERLLAEERQPWLRLYLLTVSALRALTDDRGRAPSLLLDSYLLRAMRLAGWSPALRDCARCATPGPHAAFHVPSGGVLCPVCRGSGYVRPAPETLTLMEALLAGDWARADASEHSRRAEASGLVAALLQFHLERGLRSLPFVDRAGATRRDAPPPTGSPATVGVGPGGAPSVDAAGVGAGAPRWT